MYVVDLSKDEANMWVDAYHRHSEPILQHKFSLGACVGTEFVGVATVEWPKGRGNADTWTLEVTRVVTQGHPNACSFLYGACWRAIKAHGFLRAITYTKDSESGASVRAAGWVARGYTKGRQWDTPSRPRRPAKYELSDRIRWEIRAAEWSEDLGPKPVIATARPSIPGQMELAA